MRDAQFISWGYQFEAKCTGAVTSNPNEEYGVLLRTSLGGGGGGGGGGAGATGGGGEAVRCVLGAEIDAFDPAVGPPSLASHAELKTVKAPPHQGAWRTLWRHRHPKWWLQSHLAGTQKIVLGFRDDGGVIREIHPLRVADLPSISARHGVRTSKSRRRERLLEAAAEGHRCNLCLSYIWCAPLSSRSGGHPPRLSHSAPPASCGAASLPRKRRSARAASAARKGRRDRRTCDSRTTLRPVSSRLKRCQGASCPHDSQPRFARNNVCSDFNPISDVISELDPLLARDNGPVYVLR